MNTGFIIACEPRCNEFELEMKGSGKVIKMVWNQSTGWKIDEHILEINVTDQRIDLDLKCTNCNGQHHFSKCDSPDYSMCCYTCLVVSFDGKGHVKPCKPINRITNIRQNIFALNALTLFRIRFDLVNSLFYLNDGVFKSFTPDIQLTSDVAETIVSIEEINDQSNLSQKNAQEIVLKQTIFKRCSLLLAFKDERNMWRLRFLIRVTPKHGIMAFPLTRTLNMTNNRLTVPDSLDVETVAVIGITMDNTEDTKFVAMISAYANKTGKFSTTNFDGYNSQITLTKVVVEDGNKHDVCEIGNELKGRVELKFNSLLFKNLRPNRKPLSTFQEQRGSAPTEKYKADDDKDDSDFSTNSDSD